MSYQLHLIPTGKANAPICKVISSFRIQDFGGDIIAYEGDKLYNYKDLVHNVMSSLTFPEIKEMVLNEHIQPMHLHLTDNTTPKKGQWCVKDVRYGQVYKAEQHENGSYLSGDSRIICTSDNELRQDVFLGVSDATVEENVPNFYMAFISMYIDMYNSGQPITTNLFPKMEVYGHKGRERFVVDEDNNNMTVLIKVNMPKNRKFTRDELDMHLLAVMNLGMGLRQSQLNGSDLRSGNEVLEEYKTHNLF